MICLAFLTVATSHPAAHGAAQKERSCFLLCFLINPNTNASPKEEETLCLEALSVSLKKPWSLPVFSIAFGLRVILFVSPTGLRFKGRDGFLYFFCPRAMHRTNRIS